MRSVIRWLPLLVVLGVPRLVLGAETAGQEPLFRFVVSSDPHTAENRNGEPTGKEKFRCLLRQVEQLAPKPDFLLITGDLHVPAFQEVLAETKPSLPLHVVAGNHERQQDRETLRKLFPNDFQDADFYAFTHKDSLFLGLCDAGGTDHIGHFNSESIRGPDQCQWLRNQLAQRPPAVQRVFLFGHIPPHPQGQFDRMCLGVNDQKFLRELVQQYRPTALFFGHLHRKQDFALGTTPVFGLRSSNWNIEQQPLGFLLVQVFSDRVVVEFVPLRLP